MDKNENFEGGEDVIPTIFSKAVAEIAESINIDEVCFFNPRTYEVETVLRTALDDPYEFEMITGETAESMLGNHEEWEQCIEIHPLESRDAFKIMEQFTLEVTDPSIKNRLINALQNHRPFANFKQCVHEAGIDQQWYSFEQLQLQLYVWHIIKSELELNS